MTKNSSAEHKIYPRWVISSPGGCIQNFKMEGSEQFPTPVNTAFIVTIIILNYTKRERTHIIIFL